MRNTTRAVASLAIAVAAITAPSTRAPGPAAAAPGTRAAEPRITVTDLHRTDGAPLSDAYELNERGQVVTGGSGGTGPTEAYLWDRGATTEIVAPSGGYVVPTDLTERGVVVALEQIEPEHHISFTWDDGVSTQLPPGDHWALAVDGNAHGHVAGFRLGARGFYGPTEAVLWDDGEPLDPPTTGNGSVLEVNDRGVAIVTTSGPGGYRASLWRVGDELLTPLPSTDGRPTSAHAINEAGVVAGVAAPTASDAHAVVWRAGRAIDLGTLGGATSSPGGPVALNERGHVVGTSETAQGGEHAFLWRGGRMIDLGTLGGPTSEAVAVNDRGQVVGHSDTASGERHAFLWEDGRMIDLDAVAGEGASTVVDINDRGQVIGTAFVPNPDPTAPPGTVVSRARLWSIGPSR